MQYATCNVHYQDHFRGICICKHKAETGFYFIQLSTSNRTWTSFKTLCTVLYFTGCSVLITLTSRAMPGSSLDNWNFIQRLAKIATHLNFWTREWNFAEAPVIWFIRGGPTPSRVDNSDSKQPVQVSRGLSYKTCEWILLSSDGHGGGDSAGC